MYIFSWFNMDSVLDAALPLVYIAASAALKVVVSATEGQHAVPRRASYVGRVTRLNVYPVKSMDGLHMDEAECTYTGLKLPDVELYDRLSNKCPSIRMRANRQYTQAFY
jgi:MOSC N-terminal beta barrel domain